MTNLVIDFIEDDVDASEFGEEGYCTVTHFKGGERTVTFYNGAAPITA